MEVLIGISLGFVIVFVGAAVGGGTPDIYWDIPSFFITVMGSMSAMLTSYPLPDLKKITVYFKISMRKPNFDYADLIHTLSTFAETARKEGLLALEDKIVDVDDPFLRKGIQLAIDGVDEEMIKSTLEKDLQKMEERHRVATGMFDQWATLAPSFGMIGTLMGLVIMLKNMEDISSIGPAMAVALITTFYGALIANALCIPIIRKLEILHNQEVLQREMMMEGILSLVHGENVRLLKDKLVSFLPREMRAAFEEDHSD
ncbi:MAG TPA: motility protein A [Spirochaetia bacterium]|nr:MAG: hypothetical protein A2Y41_10220 [Spirochaetes bacterium GWB1_36_13]HCL55539.1 motility protein A [Spirochaetia bacterium]